MKKKTKETVIIGIGLVVLSLLLHYAHYLIFKDAHHTLIFLFADIAFIPMEVFFTTLIIDRLLEKREKNHFLEKLNMMIGLFYTEIGRNILAEFVKGDENLAELINSNICARNWDDSSCKKLKNKIEEHDFNLNITKINIDNIKNILSNNRDFLMNLIINENIHEHEEFTDMLMSLLHVKEEIEARYYDKIQPFELEHLASDFAVAYKYLTLEWCEYMNYLNKNYPRLFVRALIDNPFDNRDKKEKDKIYLIK